MDEEKRNGLVTMALLGTAVFLMIFINSKITSYATAPAEPRAISVTEKRREKEEKPPEEIYVHVCGKVRHPGVYTMMEGNIAINAVEAAGGVTKGGDPDRVNMARPLKNGDKIEIPAAKEEKPDPERRRPEARGGGERKIEFPVNLNSADRREIEMIPGIGRATAERIAAYRADNGTIQSLDELENIPGIRKKTVEECRKYMTTE